MPNCFRKWSHHFIFPPTACESSSFFTSPFLSLRCFVVLICTSPDDGEQPFMLLSSPYVWRGAYLNPYFLIGLSFCCYELSAHSGCNSVLRKCFLPFCKLSVYSLGLFEITVSSLHEVQRDHLHFGRLCKQVLPNPRSQRFSPVFTEEFYGL